MDKSYGKMKGIEKAGLKGDNVAYDKISDI